MARLKPITVLTVSPLEEDHVSLRRICAGCHWRVVEAHNCHQALREARRNPMTVVICERDLPDGDWHDIWEGIASLAPHPTLIVMSLHADEYLWAEVLNLGGYDVLAKPFETQEVCRIVGRAWERVRAGAQAA